MQTVDYSSLSPRQRKELTLRPVEKSREVRAGVLAIIEEVRAGGDAALRRLTKKFDGADLIDLYASKKDVLEAERLVDPALHQAISAAARSIRKFHAAQVPKAIEVETSPGVTCRREWRPIQRVGLYIPGGSAPLISTVLMLGIPSQLAGCPEVILFTPPLKSGTVNREILVAAKAVGIQNIVMVGGAQAIAAMAIGTASIPKVDKIFGPGNRFVTAAKSIVSQPPFTVGTDLHAGPSELLIIADANANPRWIAVDLLSQAEHGEDSPVVLVTTSRKLVDEVAAEVNRQSEILPRCDIVQRSMGKSLSVIVQTLDQAVEFSNDYAPEHLILAVDDAVRLTPFIINAGSVFVGSMSSVVFGDYAAGANHTLPTAGTAKFRGGLTVEDFMKPVFFSTVSAKGIASLSGTVTSLARAEQLEGHARAVDVRGMQ